MSEGNRADYRYIRSGQSPSVIVLGMIILICTCAGIALWTVISLPSRSVERSFENGRKESIASCIFLHYCRRRYFAWKCKLMGSRLCASCMLKYLIVCLSCAGHATETEKICLTISLSPRNIYRSPCGSPQFFYDLFGSLSNHQGLYTCPARWFKARCEETQIVVPRPQGSSSNKSLNWKSLWAWHDPSHSLHKVFGRRCRES